MLILLMGQPKLRLLESIRVHAAGVLLARIPEENFTVPCAAMSNHGNPTVDVQNVSSVLLVGTSLPGIHGVSNTAVRTYSLEIYLPLMNFYPNGLNAEFPGNS